MDAGVKHYRLCKGRLKGEGVIGRGLRFIIGDQGLLGEGGRRGFASY